MITLLILFSLLILFISQYETARMPIDEEAQRIRTSMSDEHRQNISQLEKSLAQKTAKIAKLEAVVNPSEQIINEKRWADIDASSIRRSIEEEKFWVGVVHNWTDDDVKYAHRRGPIY